MNNWDRPIWVRVTLSPTNHLTVTDYHTFDDDTRITIDQTLGALEDHIDNVPMEADFFSYRVGMILYRVTCIG
jgi:hypothetical protein